MFAPPQPEASQGLESEGESKDIVAEMEPHHHLKRMRTLLGRVSEQGPRAMCSINPSHRPLSPMNSGSPVAPAPLPASPSFAFNALVEDPFDGDESAFRDDIQTSLKPGIINPAVPWYRAWSVLILMVAAGTGFLTPCHLAFSPPNSLYAWGQGLVKLDILLTLLFGGDVYLTTFVAFRDATDALVDDKRKIVSHYRREGTLYADIVGLLPLDYLLVFLMGGAAGIPSSLLTCISLLRLLQLARLVRLVRLFSSLEYDTRLSLLWVTMARNLSLLAYLINWFACLFQLASRGFGWSHVDVSDFNSLETIFERYLGSLYWAVETLTSPQYGNEAPRTRWELAAATARIGLFMAYDIAIGAYIMGTISLLVVKADERTGQYRDRAANLKQFVQQHAIPSDLRESMQEHLALHFQNEDASDESVLSIYPTTLRRRILRHLYGKYIQESYLFAGARQKFLDALLAACRIELYMPNVDILTDGEAVNELCLLLDGSMEIITTSAATAASQVEGEAAAQAQPLAALPSSRQGSPPPAGAQMAGADPVGLAGGLDGEGSGVTELRPREGDGRKVSRTVSLKRQLGASKEEVLNVRTIGPGCCFGEIAFFTEIPQHEVVRSVSVCRVMVVSRSTYTGIVSSFPLSARSVLSNLQRAVEHTVLAAFPTMKDSESFVSMLRRSPSTLVRHTAGVGLYAGSAAEQDDSAHMNAQDKEWRKLLKGPLSERQAVLVGNLHRTRTLLMEHTSKMDAERVTAFLYACSLGHVQTVRKMLQEGFPPDEADYDGRTGLMLACVNGHEAIARELLVCGADPLRPDAMGTCALLEAVNNGRDALISLLTRAGSRLSYGKGTVMDAVRLCTCVFECDLPKLRRLLKAGCPVDAGDYDLRTALHVCASEGNLALVRMLVEEGQADMHKRDRWGNTPLHEAMHIGAGQVVEYMREQLAGRGLPQDLALLEDTAPTESSRKGQGSSGEGSIRGGQNSNAYREGSVRGGQNFNAYRDHKSDNSIQRPASRRYSLFRRINSSLRSSWKGKAGGYGR